MGFAGAGKYGKIIPVPDRQLNASETAGLRLFVDRECAYCHNINGKGGRIHGPDLANIGIKGRTRDWLMKYIKDPQSQYSWTLMPKYDLGEKELAALSDFILCLDFRSHEMKIVTREDAFTGDADKSAVKIIKEDQAPRVKH
jgi:ubiquinol-cytochrome c reductase cytochrome b subunit